MASRSGKPASGWLRKSIAISIATLGVVYGDIGTSPLYAIRESFFGDFGVALTPQNVLGVLSLVSWALILVVSVKYVVFILRADNHGEGGILALMALIHPAFTPRKDRSRPVHWRLVGLGLFGAALLYADGLITPAISVLSAVEGLEVAAPLLEPFVVPITITILVAVFLVQQRGTEVIGRVFGPIMLLWFVTLAVLGASAVVGRPEVLLAFNPIYAVEFILRNGWEGFLVLGAVVLVVTGGEALYADIGHFGAWPIRLTWSTLVLPALVINYFGQGALLLDNPAAAYNPFYELVPRWGLYPMVVLATTATIIASQAIISGVFSLAHQAVQFGYSPRLEIRHTSPEEFGQVYVPVINWAMMAGTIGVVLAFRSSENLAAAYGVAVTATMGITTVIFCFVARDLWGWHPLAVGAFAMLFLPIDLMFFGAAMTKVTHGGWFTLLLAGGVYYLMATWRRGQQALADEIQRRIVPLGRLFERIERQPPARVPGTAVFMTRNPDCAPPALLHNLKHNKVLHERILLVTVRTVEVPRVPVERRVDVTPLEHGFYRVIARYGFMESPNLRTICYLLRRQGLDADLEQVTIFVGTEHVASAPGGLGMWLFNLMARNAHKASDFFRLPPDRVVEIGTQVELPFDR